MANGGGMLQMLVGLAAVLGLIFGLAWLLRRTGVPGAGPQIMRIVASQQLSARERLVVVELAGAWLVIGVAPGQVSRLGKFARPAITPELAVATGAPDNFAAWLNRARGALNVNRARGVPMGATADQTADKTAGEAAGKTLGGAPA